MLRFRRRSDARPGRGGGQDRRGARGGARSRRGERACRRARGRSRPWIEALADYIEEHVARLRANPRALSPGRDRSFARASHDAYARIHPLLEERGRHGLVRRIHGDLHLGNIVLLDGRPVLFDAIEFSPLIASGDVLYDLAFLLMDLTERALAQAANIVLNRYLVESERPEDLDGLAALPFFLSMRAAIRAKVTAARLAQAAASDNQRSKRVRAGISTGRSVSSSRSRPSWLPSAGCRALARRCSRARSRRARPAPGAVVLRSDLERKACSVGARRKSCRQMPMRRC